jgi:hypothetical protein
VDISKAKVGKHGAAKCHFVGIDIFTSKKYESICPASAQLAEPIVDRQEYQVRLAVSFSRVILLYRDFDASWLSLLWTVNHYQVRFLMVFSCMYFLFVLTYMLIFFPPSLVYLCR